MRLDDAIKQVASNTGIPEEVVNRAYRSMWKFIKLKAEEQPFMQEEELSKEEFDKLTPNFNIPSIGKLHCTYDRYIAIRHQQEFIKNMKKDVQD